MKRALLLLVVLLGGCGEDVVRIFDFVAAPLLPSGSCAIEGALLRVVVTGLEPLIENSHYVVWLQTPGGAVALGALPTDRVASTYQLDPTLDLAKVGAVVVTEESGRLTLPESPSNLVRLGGYPGGVLSFVPLSAAAAAVATARAEIRDESLALQASVPDLPAGLGYILWASFTPIQGGGTTSLASTPGHNHQHLVACGNDVAACAGPFTYWPAGPDLVQLGPVVSGQRAEFTAERDLLRAVEFLITVESQRGVDGMMAAAVLLRGQIAIAQGGGSAAVHSH